MDFLLKDNFEYKFNKKNGFTELCIKIFNNNTIYNGMLDNKLEVHGFKKYNLSEYLQKYIEESNVLNINYDIPNGQLYINVKDIEFENNKVYNGTITIVLTRSFNHIENIDNVHNFEDLLNITKSYIDYTKYLENKIKNLENNIYQINQDYYNEDNYYC